jgi:hypothetical protein
MLDNNLVKGFKVNINTPEPDCVACTEAKQFVEPFDQHIAKETKPRDLTHIDVWGKYAIPSINGNQYFLLMVDDSCRFNTTEFMKTKKEAAEKVQEYLAKLISHGRKPKAIRIDRRKEFLDVSSWCQKHVLYYFR